MEIVVSCSPTNVKCDCCLLQGAAADRFLDSLSGFINGLDTKNNVKVENCCREMFLYCIETAEESYRNSV